MATKKQLRDRFNSIGRQSFDEVINEPNPAAWLESSLNGDLDALEIIIESIEQNDINIKNRDEYKRDQKRKDRLSLFEKKLISNDDILMAIWESLANNDNTSLNRIKAALES